jgi:RNA polymerase sigma-70 factor (ECF subfamily)
MEQYTKQITEAYKNHADAIFKYCYFRISDREKALDFVAETYTRMWKFLIKGNEIHNQKTFLYTVARHIIIDEYRKKKIISLDFLIEQGVEPCSDEIEERPYSRMEIDRVMAHVSNLPEKYSSILILRFVNDLSIQEIANVVHESENVVSVRIHRGITSLKKTVHA